jgi:CDP-diacylglycerol--serine O-phosphatidyltransferase
MSADRKRHFTLLRSFTLADFLTMGNAASGTGAILCCLDWLVSGSPASIRAVFFLLPLALFLDFLDGRVARWRHRQSLLGADLDSLSDIISFGVAPAVLGYSLGLRGSVDVAILLFFVACGISRLARFNVTASALSDESGKVRYFEGTPIPTSLALVLIWAIAWGHGAIGESVWGGLLRLGPLSLHPFSLLYALSGCAMVSGTLRIPKL